MDVTLKEYVQRGFCSDEIVMYLNRSGGHRTIHVIK